MYCNMCGKQATDDAVFCNVCGNKLTLTLESADTNKQITKNPERLKSQGHKLIYFNIYLRIIALILGMAISILSFERGLIVEYMPSFLKAGLICIIIAICMLIAVPVINRKIRVKILILTIIELTFIIIEVIILYFTISHAINPFVVLPSDTTAVSENSEPLGLGQTVTVNDISLSVTDVTTYSGSKLTTPPSGYIFWLCHVTLTNNTNDPIKWNRNDFSLYNANGIYFEKTHYANNSDVRYNVVASSDEGIIKPMESSQINLAFLVPDYHEVYTFPGHPSAENSVSSTPADDEHYTVTFSGLGLISSPIIYKLN